MTSNALNSPEFNKECISKLKAKCDEASNLIGALERSEQLFAGNPVHVAVDYWNEAVCSILSSCFGDEAEEVGWFKEELDKLLIQGPQIIASSSVKNFYNLLASSISIRGLILSGYINRMENAVIIPGSHTSGEETSVKADAKAIIEKDTPLKCVILTALSVELHAVRSHLIDVDEVVHKGTVYDKGKFLSGRREWEVFVAELGAGNDSAAFELERAVSRFDPSVVMFVGVAGGIKDVRVGDVVAATKVYGYESGKAEVTFKPRPDVGNSSYRMVQRAKAVARKTDWTKRILNQDVGHNPRAVVGAIAAGEKVVASTESSVYQFMRANYGDALAVEMEGRGFLEAAHANPQISTLIVRGISDLLNNKSDLDDDARQSMASMHASAFAFEVLSQLDESSDV
ncbi:MAG: 5'-methylthioadenosine/S-adenosylhomocysteine nucleosidase [Acidobacteria bacterium]|nr:5'-methylthioadenosine/S-adenosylhomocysteine nucleosidase [Acidobacteriota bacterium]